MAVSHKELLRLLGTSLLALGILGGCARLSGSSSSISTGTLVASNNGTNTGTSISQGNGEGYGGRVGNAFYAMSPSNPCTNGIDTPAARSIMIQTGSGYYLTRSNCQDQILQPVPTSGVALLPSDSSVATVNGTIFEQSGDPVTLAQSGIQAVCQGAVAATGANYLVITVRQSGLSGYQEDVSLGNLSASGGGYTQVSSTEVPVTENRTSGADGYRGATAPTGNGAPPAAAPSGTTQMNSARPSAQQSRNPNPMGDLIQNIAGNIVGQVLDQVANIVPDLEIALGGGSSSTFNGTVQGTDVSAQNLSCVQQP